MTRPSHHARRSTGRATAKLSEVVTVRRLDPDRWLVLRDTRLRALEDAPYAFGSTWEAEQLRPEEWWKASVADLCWYVAYQDGDPVGLAACLPRTEAEHLEVISMWVDGDHRGSGAAAALMVALIGWATDQGATGLTLNVAQDNHRARRFYERAGFRPTGRSEPLLSRPSVMTEELRLEFGVGDGVSRLA